MRNKQNKSILVLDTPKNCIDCDLIINDGDFFTDCMICIPTYTSEGYASVDKYCKEGTKPEWCPLKPLPSYKKLKPDCSLESQLEYQFNQGYNTCLQGIGGEENDRE